MKITYYTEVISSWCYWAEPAWATLKAKYEGRVEFDWKLALMDETGLPVSREQLEWFYRRSGTIRQSPFILNSGWYEPSIKEYLAPNLVPLAAKVMGIKGDIPRLAIAHAALREGAQVWKWEVSAEIVSRAVDLHEKQLLELARSPEIEKQARTTTAEFHALQVSQRPVFVLESAIGDKAVFSGLATAEPLEATLQAMISDAAAYASYAAHFGAVPQQ
ncbi:MAG: disulfide bond formation protein DsbA [Verrucomicrobiales bacterium]|jgi:predicted DsbA family dithiol-disulfide isomerase|nr:disulfide bond formation protein DsbA [Verrucomicrobiales bacterium]